MIILEEEEDDSIETQFEIDYRSRWRTDRFKTTPARNHVQSIRSRMDSGQITVYQTHFCTKYARRVAEQGFKSLSEQWLEKSELRKIDNFIEIKNEV
jgi:hypothetical protein